MASLAPCGIALRQLARIARACASSHCWSTPCEHIEIGFDGDGGQEIAADALDAIGYALRLKERQRRLDPVRAIEQDAAKIGIGLQETCEQAAMAAAKIRDALDPRKVERRDDARSLGQRLLREIRVEQRAGFGVVAAPIRNVLAEDLFESGLGRCDRSGEIGPGAPILRDDDLHLLP